MKIRSGQSLVLATKNTGKITELRDLLRPFGLKTLTLGELGLREAEEIGTNIRENAIIKARSCAELSQLPALADDSGLSVRALGGQPGVFTANWAGPNLDFGHAMEKIHDELQRLDSHPDDRAFFQCCLVLWFPDGTHYIFEEKVDGHLVWPPRGTNNMGFDPIFVPLGSKKTYGEMSLQEKQKVSHRFAAFRRFSRECIEA